MYVRINKTIRRIVLETSTISFNFLFRSVTDLLNYNEREIIWLTGCKLIPKGDEAWIIVSLS